MNGLSYFKPTGLVRSSTAIIPGFGGGGSSYDPAAAAYFAAAGITDSTQKDAYNTLVTSLRSYGIYSKMFALYPFLGGTASSHKWNAINPLDTDGAFRIVWNGTVTHSANGVQGNGTTGYGDTKFVPSTSGFTTTNGSFGIYSRTNVAGGYDFSASNGAGLSSQAVIARYTGDNFFVGYGTLWPVANTDSRGLFCCVRNGASNNEGFKNGTRVINAAAGQALQTSTMTIGADNRAGSYTEFSSRQYALAYIGQAMSTTEQANLYTAVQAFQTALGRQVVPDIALVSSRTQSLGLTGGTTTAIDTTGANLIVVSLSYYHTGNTGDITITDSKGNTWTLLTKYANATTANRLYYCKNANVGSGHTFTTPLLSAYYGISIMAFSMANITTPFDVENGANSLSASSLATGSITPSQANSLIVAGLTFDNNAGGAVSIDSGMTAISTAYSGGSSMGTGIAYKVQSTAAAINPTWNITNAAAVAASIAAFKP